MIYSEQVKSTLWADIDEMAINPVKFSRNPETDFSRNRKINFSTLMRFSISMESSITNHELIKYFEYDSHLLKTFNSYLCIRMNFRLFVIL